MKDFEGKVSIEPRKKPRTWVFGLLAKPKGEALFRYATPEEISDNKSPHFSKCYNWLFWYFYKVRTCDRCGKLACGKGLIRYYNSERTRTLAYFCPECARKVPELKKKARKYCQNCERDCVL